MDTATPRTDAEHSRLLRISEGPFWIAGKDYVAMREHSEKLERELIASAERVARLEAALQSIAARSNGASYLMGESIAQIARQALGGAK